jgi:hypothetical protein
VLVLRRVVDRRRVDAPVVDRRLAAEGARDRLRQFGEARSIVSWMLCWNARTVPTSFASRGITEKAPGLPAASEHSETTAASIGAVLRATMLCAAVMMWPAISTGSTVRCGCAAWPPRPLMVISIRSAAAIIGPGFRPMWPAGSPGQLCIA